MAPESPRACLKFGEDDEDVSGLPMASRREEFGDADVSGLPTPSRGEKSASPTVAIIHHDDMQLHHPPRYREIYELPRRVIAIENRLKGLDLREGFPPECNFGGRMQFLPASSPVAFGSPAPKKRRRTSYSSGPSADGRSVWDACRIVEAPEVEESDLLLVHSKSHIAEVKSSCELAMTETASFQPLSSPCADKNAKTPKVEDVNSDVYYSPDSLIAFRRAAGGAVQAVRELFELEPDTGRAATRSKVRSSFAIVRPPGHHCCNEPTGFCFFNNSAVAASHARHVLGLSRVAVVDWDYHHGDGTQKLFYEDPSVLTISLHVALTADGIAFPSNRSMGSKHVGQGKGVGYNINIPWPHDGVGADEYREAFQTVVVPALKSFNPELIIVAAGFDAVAGDMLAGTCLQARDYHEMTSLLLSLDLPLAVILEGGYSPHLIAEAADNVVHALLGRDPPQEKPRSPASAAKAANTGGGAGRNIKAHCVLDAVRRHLNTILPWSALSGAEDSKCFSENSFSGSTPSDAAARVDKLIDQLAERD
eukprot:TRINITY_DN17342_c0_g1_i1.p1 TRINITY_DN17342_c0_g1~~TRINITY_DN17342_c0_g1_i1.p1  ORF type:complete len:536 (+),score=88.62 TRINITY_DN17342_c0_g1_i1:30-1637(+)